MLNAKGRGDMQIFVKLRTWIAVLVAVVTIGFPVGIMINGYILMAQNDPDHPDALVLIGFLLLGIVGLIGVLVYGIHGYRVGWRHLSLQQRILLGLYGVSFVLGLLIWLTFVEAIPGQWVDWLIYG